MKRLDSEFWQISLPDDWISDEDDGCTSIYHDKGVGMLEVSAVEQPDEIVPDDLLSLASEHLDQGAKVETVELGDFDGIELNYVEDDIYWREWYLKSGKLLLFVTYNCDTGDEEKEEGMLDVMLATLKTAP